MNRMNGDLFEPLPPRARSADPDTSHAAARAAKPRAPGHRERIFAALACPMTQFDLARVTGLRPEQVHKRLSELARDNPATGFKASVVDTGHRKEGDNGVLCIVWRRV